MMRYLSTIFLILFFFTTSAAPIQVGTPDIESMGVLEFNEDGILFVGDSYSGKVFALDLNDNVRSDNLEAVIIEDLEGDIAGLVGTSAENVLLHDMAVNPISQNIYVSVSRARAKWKSRWELPNDLASADILLRISLKGEITEVSLDDISYSSIDLPNPVVADEEHEWKKGVMTRVDAITSIEYSNGNLYVAGLSNEEFAASMWVTPYPFEDDISASTLEIYHGAHGEYETHAPIRTFLPYKLRGEENIIAAYLCTPLVTFPSVDLQDGQHIRGRTIAEFGSGNYPLDMVTYINGDRQYILMSNSQLPLMIIDPEDIRNFEGSITEEVEGYRAGVNYTPRSGSGVQQLDDLNEKFLLATQRMPSGKLALVSFSKEWLRP